MKKRKTSVVKEVFIIILLLILILLILAVALYDFIPSNISVPEVVEYSSDSTTTSIKQEIAYTNGGDLSADQSTDEKELVTSLKSYSINASDLNLYGQKNLYNSGNSNPFDYVKDDDSAASDPNNTTTNQAGGSTTNTTTSNATGTFFESPTSK